MDIVKKQKELEKFKNEIDSKTMDELLEIEKKLIADQDEMNEKVQSHEFILTTKGYKEAAEAIRHFIDKQSVSWQYTVGLLTMYDFWNPDKCPKKGAYPMVDGTLRTLGDMKFTGHEEWKMVIKINEYFKDIRDEYAKITEGIYDLGTKHSIVCDKMKILDPASANLQVGE